MKTGDDSQIECIADALGAIPGIEWLPVAFGIKNPWDNIPNGGMGVDTAVQSCYQMGILPYLMTWNWVACYVLKNFIFFHCEF